MKTIIFFFLLWLFAASCATVAVTPQEVTACTKPLVYLTGNDEPAAYGLFLAPDEPISVSSTQSQSAVEPPVYYTGNDEPAAFGLFLAPDEPDVQ
jgi:hypothetical protein